MSTSDAEWWRQQSELEAGERRYCIRGHDTEECGRYMDGTCRRCHIDRNKARYKRLKAEGRVVIVPRHGRRMRSSSSWRVKRADES